MNHMTCKAIVAVMYLSCLCCTEGIPIARERQTEREKANTDEKGGGEYLGCQLEGKHYLHGDNVSRGSGDPCEKCFCFRSEVLCWKMTCPMVKPREECKAINVDALCCPAYECPDLPDALDLALVRNMTGAPEVATITYSRAQSGTQIGEKEEPEDEVNISHAVSRCFIDGKYYRLGDIVESASSPCIRCICSEEGNLHCSPLRCAATFIADVKEGGTVSEGLITLPEKMPVIIRPAHSVSEGKAFKKKKMVTKYKN